MKRRLILAAVLFAAAGQAGAACTLLAPAELEAVVGPVILEGGAMPNEGELCTGRAPAGTVTVRRYKRTASAARKPDPIACATAEAHGRFNTSCTAAKPPMFAVIEVVGEQKMPMEKLRPLAEKMLGRL